MDRSSLLSVPGNFEASQMHQLSEQLETIPGCEAARSMVTAETSITACKKVLCSNSLLDSAEYWLQNEKKLCQVGFLEDKARSSCPTICFVNIDGVDTSINSKELQQKLDTVSPDLPHLINSLNICQMKDNELILVSGLIAPGSCQDNADDSQDQKDESTKYLEDESLPPPTQWTRPPDVCLVQSARRCRKNDMACVIYEINKCMIGLDYFKGRKKHLVSTANWKTEEETNYSGSSIEEDFLTASEQLNDEQDPPRISGFDPARGTKKSKAKSRVLLQMRQNKGNRFCQNACNLQDTSAHKCADEESSGSVPLLCCEGNNVPEERDGERHKSERNVQEETLVLKSPHSNHLANSGLEEHHNSCTIECVGTHIHTDSSAAPVDTQDTEDKPSASPSLKENHCMEGDYASNLAESVLQDAFIRLSQSEPTFTTEAAVSISAESIDALSPSNTKESVTNPPCPWNVLPKIVIVQSPDNCDNASEWQEPCSPTIASCLDSDPFNETPCYAQENIIDQNNSESTGLPPSSVEVALVCAANVIGTISSPYITESLQLDQALYDVAENLPCDRENGDGALPSGSNCGDMNFSFSSALYGVTQVASAIGVAGLNDEPDLSFPATSSGLLSAAETSAAVTLQCSVGVGSCVETFAHNIAEVLFKEAATVLIKPDNYRSVGGFMESVDRKIIETVTRPKVSHWEELSKDDFALNMSNLILKHSFEEANSKVGKVHQEKENHSGVNPTTIFIESVNKSLFSILYFTCRKIKDIVGHNDVTMLFQDDGIMNSKDSEMTNKVEGISVNHNPNGSIENVGHVPSGQGNLTDPTTSYEKSCVGPDLSQQVNLNPMWLHSRRGSDCANIAHNLTNQLRSRNNGAAITNVAVPQHQQNICNKDINSSFSTDALEVDSRYASAVQARTYTYIGTLTDMRAQPHPDKDQNVLMISPPNTASPSKSPFQVEKSADTNLSINGFADQISKTVVSMATEMAAICLENTNAKQPWFCPWKTRLGDHDKFLVPQSSRALTRGKESQTTTAKRLKPPRLSEIKRKTQEKPELKEKLMNRVVDESLNFDDALDQINNFTHEVTAKIVNSAELTVIDSMRQGQGLTRNRLLGDRWSRGKTSSYESIPEEDMDFNSSWAALGAMTKFGQPISRSSSISKQSSCESITDEFSNFMMNQMENEGWGFELLLDYYASKHASNILNAALQQVCRKSGHLGVNATCLSKQSSTESITEEFYRYMLRELDKESKETKANKEFHNMLLPPAGRTTLCFRQSSMPDRRASEGRLTVTPPVKANSFDGFVQNDRRNTLHVHLGDAQLSTNLYKSLTDSCLYRKNKTDHITDMLISETWSNSIEALMRKNKIICDDADIQSGEQLSGGAQQHAEQSLATVVTDTVKCGKSISSSQQGSVETATHDSGTESKICDSDLGHRAEKAKLVTDKKCFTSHDWAAVKKKKLSHCPREVPSIHIENDQKEEIKQCPQGKAAGSTKRQMERKFPEADSEGQTESGSLMSSFMKNLVALENATAEENPCSLSTSDDSMGSWSQLINEEDHAEDSSSYLHLSESNGNSSASSSLGLVDLDAYQENLSIRTLPSEIISEKETVKDNQESLDENTSQMAIGTFNCHMDFLVLNLDLSPECVDAELRAILQWIAASELGFPVIYFKKSQEKRIQKFLDVIHFADQKAWKLKDLFLAIMQFCELQEDGGRLPTSSLFDWLLEFG
ncbi:A-kinase anchor protein SPHKAP isoform X2 [Pristis pectinata]|uniref:A-kinase anchor protein SPHKAP isoform X2 n=1 Tax=Pristis pectinata TaxID=685728 RepID=UPI00223E1FED|nr:A-kinase anchor protein SPHKAP isoform X2 [Pristis pectinata]